MEIGTIVNWLQLIFWLVALVLFITKLLTGKVSMPNWVTSNKLIGAVIGLGLVVSGISLYINYRVFRIGSLEGITVSAYQPVSGPLTVVSGETFENTDVPLDGHVYDHVTFINCCLLYDGVRINCKTSRSKTTGACVLKTRDYRIT